MTCQPSSKKKAFTVIFNEVAQHDSLSMEARGLLLLMHSMPKDWKFNQVWLQNNCPNCGREKLKRMLKELEEHGYLVRTPKKNGHMMAGHDWKIYHHSIHTTPPETYEPPHPESKPTGRQPEKTGDGKAAPVARPPQPVAKAKPGRNRKRGKNGQFTKAGKGCGNAKNQKPATTKETLQNTTTTNAREQRTIMLVRQKPGETYHEKMDFDDYLTVVGMLLRDMIDEGGWLPGDMPPPKPSWVHQKAITLYEKFPRPAPEDCAVIILKDWARLTA